MNPAPNDRDAAWHGLPARDSNEHGATWHGLPARDPTGWKPVPHGNGAALQRSDKEAGSQLRLVFLVKRFRPDIGGVEKYVQELARALVAIGHQVSVVTGDPTASRPRHERLCYDDAARRLTLDVHRFHSARSPVRAAWQIARLYPLFRRADVVHVSDIEMLELFARSAGRLIRPRVLTLTRHGMSGRDPVEPSERRRAAWARSYVDAMFDDGAFIERRYGATPDAVPDPGLRPTADELASTAQPPPDSAAFIGRLEPDSGIESYLNALSELRQRHGITLSLDVYGDGSMADTLRRRAERDDLPVTWHGRVADAQDRLPDACLAFVSGRMAIFEAMARRRLVVAAYVDPLKRDYVCGEWFSPLIVKGATGRELADELAAFVRAAARRHEWTDRAFTAVRRLSWRATAETYLETWTRLARRSAASRVLHRPQRQAIAT